jgi:hypothetical protein
MDSHGFMEVNKCIYHRSDVLIALMLTGVWVLAAMGFWAGQFYVSITHNAPFTILCRRSAPS